MLYSISINQQQLTKKKFRRYVEQFVKMCSNPPAKALYWFFLIFEQMPQFTDVFTVYFNIIIVQYFYKWTRIIFETFFLRKGI